MGALVDTEDVYPWPYEEYRGHLRQTAAKVVAASKGGDLWFIGRSLECVFDYLSGLGANAAPWSMGMVNVSLRGKQYDRPALRELLAAAGLEPAALHRRKGPQVLCDVVHSGDTMEKLVAELRAWTEDSVDDVPGVMRSLRVVGVTQRQKSSPKAERWHLDNRWAKDHPEVAVHNVSAHRRFWDWAGNSERKVSVTNPPSRWGMPIEPGERYSAVRLKGIRDAVANYDLGDNGRERKAFTAVLAKTHNVREPWVRRLISELRGTAQR